MRKRSIYGLCLLLSILGIALIFAGSRLMEPSEMEIHDIDKDMAGEKVRVQGEVVNSYVSGGHSFTEVSDGSSSIKVANFDSTESYPEGKEINVTGTVSIYEGEVEIIAEEIELYQK